MRTCERLRQPPCLQAFTPYASLQSYTHGLPRHTLWAIHADVPISTATIIMRLFIPVHLLLLLFPTSKTFYQYVILTTCLSDVFRYAFNVKSDAGFVAPMITRGFSHFWKFPCLVLTYSRNLQAGLSALTTSKHFSSPSLLSDLFQSSTSTLRRFSPDYRKPCCGLYFTTLLQPSLTS